MLKQFQAEYRRHKPQAFADADGLSDRCRGDVQFRMYSDTAPITPPRGIRAVTLFELSELVEMAGSRNKFVVLLSGPCGATDCGRTRTDALRPLLTQPKLRVWSHLVCDI